MGDSRWTARTLVAGAVWTLAAWAGPARAQTVGEDPSGGGPSTVEPDGDGVEPMDDALAQSREQLDARRQVLQSEVSRTEQQAAALERLQLLVDDASILLDDRRERRERVEAAGRLGARGDRDAVPFLRAAVRASGVDVQVAAVRAAADLDDLSLADDALRDPRLLPTTRREAIRVLATAGQRRAGEMLWAAANELALDRPLRREAADGLEAGYPELIAELGEPRTASDPVGYVAGVAGNGLAGGILLSSIGTWGRNDAAVVIGAVGGSAVGLGTGMLYAREHPLTAGQGLRYASNVGWGLTGALLADPITFGTGEWTRTRDNVNALYRSVGVATGAALAVPRLDEDIDVRDVLESDLAGYLGLQIGLGIADLAWAGHDRVDRWECEHWSPDEPAMKACRVERWRISSRYGAALLGAAAGLGLQAGVRESWELQPEDLLLASVIGAEAAWVGGWMPDVLDVRHPDPPAHVLAPLHAGFAAALLAAHNRPVQPSTSLTMGWGAVLGNAGGAGFALLADADDQALGTAMLTTGVAGTVAGGVLGSRLGLDTADLSMLAVGVPLATAEGEAIAYYLDQKGWIDGDQHAGLALASFAVSGVGLTALATRVEPEPADMLFLGTAAAWGVWYGTLTPIALRLPGDPEDAVISATITGDGFLLVGGLALLPAIDLDPRRTVLAQLGGVVGATAGALAVAMGSTEGEDVAAGAVVGSTLGLLGGAVLTPMVGTTAADLAPGSRLEVPGDWTVQLAPTVLDDGSPGLYAGIAATGL